MITTPSAPRIKERNPDGTAEKNISSREQTVLELRKEFDAFRRRTLNFVKELDEFHKRLDAMTIK